jgi:hypothetical protein
MIDELDLVSRFGEVDPLPSEALERAESVLRAAMAAAHKHQLSRIENEPHRRGPRRRTVTIAVAAAMVVVCAVLLAASSDAPRNGNLSASTHDARGGSRPSTPTVPTQARLVAKVTAALDDLSGDIFHVRTVSDNRWSYDTWLSPDGNTTRTTAYDNGVENNDLTYTVSGVNQSATVVDYTDHAWWSYTEPVAPSPSNCNPPTCADQANGGLPPGPSVDGVPGSTAGVKWLLLTGKFTVTSGTQVVNGVDTYEMTRPLAGGSTFSLWIDQATDLPVQVQSSGSTNPGNNNMSEVSWLPPTSANLGALQVQVPSGFIHSPRPISPPAPTGGGVG